MSETDHRTDGSGEANAHLQDIEDGCAEVWEHLSEERAGRQGED